MAGGVSNYAALNARVRIMYSELLGAEQHAGLSAAPDLPGLVESFQRTVYAPYIENLKDRALTARSTEAQLKARVVAAHATLMRTAPYQARRILDAFQRRFDVDSLKAILRLLAMGRSASSFSPGSEASMFATPGAASIPAEAMLQSGSIGAAVELLRGTQYYEVLAVALKRYSAEQSLFPLEVALDLHYWRQLWHEAAALQGQDQVQARRVLGSLVDMNNLLWILRYRLYQQLSEEEIINYTLPFGYRLLDEDVRALAAGADIGAVVARVYPDLKDFQFQPDAPRGDLPLLELDLKRRVRRQCLAQFVGDPFHIGVALAYLVLLDLEVQDLTVLVEAKSSQLPTEKFGAYLNWDLSLKA